MENNKYPINKNTEPDIVNIERKELKRIYEKINRLEFASSKKQLGRYDEMKGGPRDKMCSISFYEGKYVLGWKNMTHNSCETDEHNAWHENLRTTLIFDDGTTKEVDWTLWQRNHRKIPAKVLEQIVSSNGHVDYSVELENGKKFAIGVEFVNA